MRDIFQLYHCVNKLHLHFDLMMISTLVLEQHNLFTVLAPHDH